MRVEQDVHGLVGSPPIYLERRVVAEIHARACSLWQRILTALRYRAAVVTEGSRRCLQESLANVWLLTTELGTISVPIGNAFWMGA
jgi:hypothetical protein